MVSGVARGISRGGLLMAGAELVSVSTTWARPGLSHSGSGESNFTLPSAAISMSVSRVLLGAP
jgi:hypothetical protein